MNPILKIQNKWHWLGGWLMSGNLIKQKRGLGMAAYAWNPHTQEGQRLEDEEFETVLSYIMNFCQKQKIKKKEERKKHRRKKIPSAENCQKEWHSCHKHDSMKSGVWKTNVYRTKGKSSFSIQGKKDPGKRSPRKAVLKEDSKRHLFVPCL